VTTILLDTHAIHWWASDRSRLSAAATEAILNADDLLAADVSWWELASLATHGRIGVHLPVRNWLQSIAEQIRTIGLTPAIAASAAALPRAFPADPVDRVIYATAIETGAMLVTKDQRLRDHPHRTAITIW